TASAHRPGGCRDHGLRTAAVGDAPRNDRRMAGPPRRWRLARRDDRDRLPLRDRVDAPARPLLPVQDGAVHAQAERLVVADTIPRLRVGAAPVTGLVHDYLLVMRGAERTFAQIAACFPDAKIYTLLYDERRTQGHFAGRVAATSALQRLPIGQQ